MADGMFRSLEIRTGKEPWYLIVLNCDSENGLSSDVLGLERLCEIPSSESSSLVVFAVIGAPLSEWIVTSVRP